MRDDRDRDERKRGVIKHVASGAAPPKCRPSSSACARPCATLAAHDTPPPTAIDAAAADVIELCENGVWRLPKRTVKLGEAIDLYLAAYEAKRRGI